MTHPYAEEGFNAREGASAHPLKKTWVEHQSKLMNNNIWGPQVLILNNTT